MLGCPLKDAFGNSDFSKKTKNNTPIKKKIPHDIESNELHSQYFNENLKDIKDKYNKIIDDLITEIKKIKSENNKEEMIEGYSIPNNIINDQFNELLLFIFTGIFFILSLDYIYKFGKKSF